MMKDQPGGPDDRIESGWFRYRIDTGAFGDKIDFPDPAVAPLFTDSEAGGARVRERDILGPAVGRAHVVGAAEDRGTSRHRLYAAGFGVLVLLIVATLFAFALPQ